MIEFILMVLFAGRFLLDMFVVLAFAAQHDLWWLIPAPIFCFMAGYWIRGR